MDLKTVREGFELMERGMRKLNGGPLDYYITRLTNCYQLLLDKYAPFQIGDRVVLTETLEIKPDSGWYSYRHFLVKGAIGIVREVDADTDGFSAGIEFEDESWIPDFDSPSQGIVKGTKVPIKDKHQFWLHERHLVKIP